MRDIASGSGVVERRSQLVDSFYQFFFDSIAELFCLERRLSACEARIDGGYDPDADCWTDLDADEIVFLALTTLPMR